MAISRELPWNSPGTARPSPPWRKTVRRKSPTRRSRWRARRSSSHRLTPSGPAPEGMVWIPGGTFWMGSSEFPDAQPVHKVYVDGFWMDRTEVSNAQFAAFVQATGYVTVVERPPDPAKFGKVQPFSLV